MIQFCIYFVTFAILTYCSLVFVRMLPLVEFYKYVLPVDGQSSKIYYYLLALINLFVFQFSTMRTIQMMIIY